MVDPITLATGAVGAFKLLRKGLNAGKQIHEVSNELSSVLDYISGVEAAKKANKQNNPLNDYIQHQRAQQMKKDLEEVIWQCHGSKGVALYKDFVAAAAKTQRDSKYAAMARKNKILNALSILLGITITFGGAGALVWFAIEFKP